MTRLYLRIENTLVTKSFEGTIKQPPNLSNEFRMFGDAYGTIMPIPLHHKQKFGDWTNQQRNI